MRDANYQFGEVDVCPVRRRVKRNGEEVALGDRALDVLLHLIAHRDRVVEKAELLRVVWRNSVVEESNLHVQVSALRRGLGPDTITTVHGVGYRFTAGMADHWAPGDRQVLGTATRSVDGARSSAFLLYGREGAMEALNGLLDQCSMVSIVGPGGVGKSRLAKELALDRASAHADGVWFVDFSAVTREGVLRQIAQALAMPQFAAASPEAMCQALRVRPMLLVLDNCEHVVEALAPWLTELVCQRPLLQLVLTSRESCGVPGERVFELPPLELPEVDDVAPLERAACMLFVARIGEANHHLTLCRETEIDVIAICRELDGLPLALELAASRVPLMGLKALRASLHERLHWRNASSVQPARQGTLQATLRWSFMLLSTEEQAALLRLAAFNGDLDLDMAVAAVGCGHDSRHSALQCLDGLRRKCLIHAVSSGARRWRLSQTTRLFALDFAHSVPTSRAIFDHMAKVVGDWWETWYEDFFQSNRSTADLDHSGRLEIANLEGALQWACRPGGDWGLAARVFGASARAWFLDGDPAVGHRWADSIAAMRPKDPDAIDELSWLTSCLHFAPTSMDQADARIDALQRMTLLMERFGSEKRSMRAQTASFLGLELVATGRLEEGWRWTEVAADLERPTDPPRLRAWRIHVQMVLKNEFSIGAVDSAEIAEVLEDLLASRDGLSKMSFTVRVDRAIEQLLDGAFQEARDSLAAILTEGEVHHLGSIQLACPHVYLALAELGSGEIERAKEPLRYAIAAALKADTIYELAAPTAALCLALEGRNRSAVELIAACEMGLKAQGRVPNRLQQLAMTMTMETCARTNPPEDIKRWQSVGSRADAEWTRAALRGDNPRFNL